MATMNDTQITIAQQARQQGIKAQPFIVDDNTVRLHGPRRRGYRTTNMDVTYVPGLDLYRVERHEISMDPETFEINIDTKEFDGVYADSLATIWRAA